MDVFSRVDWDNVIGEAITSNDDALARALEEWKEEGDNEVREFWIKKVANFTECELSRSVNLAQTSHHYEEAEDLINEQKKREAEEKGSVREKRRQSLLSV